MTAGSRLRGVFKRQDSSVFETTPSVPAAPADHSDTPSIELDSYGEDKKDLDAGRTHADDVHVSDPSALSAAELSPEALDENGNERPMEVGCEAGRGGVGTRETGGGRARWAGRRRVIAGQES